MMMSPLTILVIRSKLNKLQNKGYYRDNFTFVCFFQEESDSDTTQQRRENVLLSDEEVVDDDASWVWIKHSRRL